MLLPHYIISLSVQPNVLYSAEDTLYAHVNIYSLTLSLSQTHTWARAHTPAHRSIFMCSYRYTTYSRCHVRMLAWPCIESSPNWYWWFCNVFETEWNQYRIKRKPNDKFKSLYSTTSNVIYQKGTTDNEKTFRRIVICHYTYFKLYI